MAKSRAERIERLAAAILADGRSRMEGKSNDYRLRWELGLMTDDALAEMARYYPEEGNVQ